MKRKLAAVICLPLMGMAYHYLRAQSALPATGSGGYNRSFPLLYVIPYPANEYVTLKVTDFSLHDLRYDLYDTEVKLIAGDNITGSETNILMGSLPAAAYLLTVRNNESVHTFKIIKNR